jgi:integrase
MINRLSARGVATLVKLGMHTDGAGLYLRVRSASSRSWFFIWTQSGKRREMGLGAPPAVTLQRAREKAQAVREAIDRGEDPLAQQRAQKAIPTFGELADQFIATNTSGVRSSKSVDRWRRAIGATGYAAELRPMQVDKIDRADVLAVLKPIWTNKYPTATLLRGYIETVLKMAKARGLRMGDNPAALDLLAVDLPKQKRLQRGHHAALPFPEVPAFMSALRLNISGAARALEFTILCAARTGETLGAKWEEIDLKQKIWILPPHRMKSGVEHRVPLSSAAVDLLKRQDCAGDYVFPGAKVGRPMSNMSMEMVLRRLGVETTVHGFRSSFRDWAGEMTETPREVAEAALAHAVGDAVERAYRRGDALQRRRVLMEAWATFCGAAEDA